MGTLIAREKSVTVSNKIVAVLPFVPYVFRALLRNVLDGNSQICITLSTHLFFIMYMAYCVFNLNIFA